MTHSHDDNSSPPKSSTPPPLPKEKFSTERVVVTPLEITEGEELVEGLEILQGVELISEFELAEKIKRETRERLTKQIALELRQEMEEREEIESVLEILEEGSPEFEEAARLEGGARVVVSPESEELAPLPEAPPSPSPLPSLLEQRRDLEKKITQEVKALKRVKIEEDGFDMEIKIHRPAPEEPKKRGLSSSKGGPKLGAKQAQKGGPTEDSKEDATLSSCEKTEKHEGGQEGKKAGTERPQSGKKQANGERQKRKKKVAAHSQKSKTKGVGKRAEGKNVDHPHVGQKSKKRAKQEGEKAKSPLQKCQGQTPKQKRERGDLPPKREAHKKGTKQTGEKGGVSPAPKGEGHKPKKGREEEKAVVAPSSKGEAHKKGTKQTGEKGGVAPAPKGEGHSSPVQRTEGGEQASQDGVTLSRSETPKGDRARREQKRGADPTGERDKPKNKKRQQDTPLEGEESNTLETPKIQGSAQDVSRPRGACSSLPKGDLKSHLSTLEIHLSTHEPPLSREQRRKEKQDGKENASPLPLQKRSKKEENSEKEQLPERDERVLQAISRDTKGVLPPIGWERLAQKDSLFSLVSLERYLFELFVASHRQRKEGGAKIHELAPYLVPAARKALLKRSQREFDFSDTPFKVRTLDGVAVHHISVTLLTVDETAATIEALFTADYIERYHGVGERSSYRVVERWRLLKEHCSPSPSPTNPFHLSCPSCHGPVRPENPLGCAHCHTLFNPGKLGWTCLEIQVLKETHWKREALVTTRDPDPEPPLTLPETFSQRTEQFWTERNTSERELLLRVNQIFSLLHEAHRKRRPATLWPHVSERIYQEFQFWQEAYEEEEIQRMLVDPKIQNVAPVALSSDPFFLRATLRLHYERCEFTLHERNGMLAGNGDYQETPKSYWERWTFVRPRVQNVHRLTSCYACGEPIAQGIEVYKCPNCHVPFEKSQGWLLFSIDPEQVQQEEHP